MLNEDLELSAMAQVLKILKELDGPEAQERTLAWVAVRLGLKAETLAGKVNKNIPPIQDNFAPVQREGTVNNAVTKLGADSCRGLLVAAAAYLSFYQGKEKFTREELISAAKQARSWKSSYSNQTSTNINRLCDSGELIEKGKDVYDIAPGKITELEQKLAA